MARCECGGCRRAFGSLELFDAHQHWDRRGEWELTCSLPSGLVQGPGGTWQTPEGLAYHQVKAARLAAARARWRAGKLAEALPGIQVSPGPETGSGAV